MISRKKAQTRSVPSLARMPAALLRVSTVRSTSSITAAAGTMITLPRSRRTLPDAVAIISLPSEQRMCDADDSRPEDNYEQRREQAEDQRKQDLDRHLLRLLLSPLPTPQPHLLRLLTQDRSDGDAQFARLDKRRHERPQLRDGGASDHRAQCMATGGADLHLLQRAGELRRQRTAGELRRQRTAGVACDLAECRVEAEPGLHADGEHVQRVRQQRLDPRLPLDAR